MFEELSKNQRIILYTALVHAVETNSGIGFLNNDQRHPAYMMGANGEVDHGTWGDSPDANDFYRMLVELAPTAGEERPRVITTWEEFCKLAVGASSRD
jgi:hypothetical protein